MNKRPVTKTDWQAFYSLLEKVPYQVSSPDWGLTSKSQPLDLNLLLKGTPTKAWNDPLWSIIGGTLTDYQEFYRHLDCSSSGQRAAEIATQYFVRKPLGQITNMIHKFHDYVDGLLKKMYEELGTEEDELRTTWPPLLPLGKADCPNGVSVVELLCPADLITEHSVMKHCINTYDYSAFSGSCRLVSFRHEGKVLASAEIRLAQEVQSAVRRHNQQFYCVQLRGVRNNPVPVDAPAGRACRWLMQGLESGKISSNQVWPSQTHRLNRFAKLQWESRISREAAAWIKQHMGVAN